MNRYQRSTIKLSVIFISLNKKGLASIMKKFYYFLFISLPLCFAPNALSQNARSLFSSGTGVSIENKAPNAVSRPATGESTRVSKEKDFTGLSYSVYQELEGGNLSKVSPKKSFRTGDRIRVVVLTNKDGYLSVFNIDPARKLSLVSEQRAKSGENINIPEKGFLKFVGAAGAEELIFVLSARPLPQSAKNTKNTDVVVALACVSAKVVTRSLVVADSTGNEFNVIEGDGSCAEKKGTTRSLVVEVADDSGYGVVPAAALESGQMLTLKIKLHHE